MINVKFKIEDMEMVNICGRANTTGTIWWYMKYFKSQLPDIITCYTESDRDVDEIIPYVWPSKTLI